MTKWVNNDGLEVLFGSSKSVKRTGGETDHSGSLRELHFTITGTDVPATDAPIDKRLTIPSGAYIDEAVINVTTPFGSGGSATLDIGLMLDDGDGTYSTLDDNGIDAALAHGTLVDNYRVVMNGAQINTTVTDTAAISTTHPDLLPLAVSWGYNSAAFNAGVADVVIKYRV